VRSPLDRADFLTRLAPLKARFGVEVHAYAVLDTHFHLLLHSRGGGFSADMQELQQRWSLVLSQGYGKVGPASQARYCNRLIEDEGYLAMVLAFIHIKPVDAGLACVAGRSAADHPPSLSWPRTAALAADCPPHRALCWDRSIVPRGALPRAPSRQVLCPSPGAGATHSGPHTPSVRQSLDEAPKPDLAALLARLERALGRDLRELGPPRVGGGSEGFTARRGMGAVSPDGADPSGDR
jgi:hypothetical protein